MNKITISVLFSLISIFSFSQNFEFRNTDKEFVEDVETFIGKFDKKKAKEISEELKNKYSIFSSSQKEVIVKFSNDLVKKKLKVKPSFINYFESIVGFSDTKLFSEKQFKNWQEVMEKLIASKNRKKLESFLKFTSHLFKDGIITKSTSSQWEMDKGTYEFFYKKGGAYVKFINTDLLGKSKKTELFIYQTSGEYNVASQVFIGDKGTVTWERLKLPKSETFAELSTYKISMRSAGFDADSVLMHTPHLKNPIYGKLREKAISYSSIEKARYPSFASYNQEIKLNNIFPPKI